MNLVILHALYNPTPDTPHVILHHYIWTSKPYIGERPNRKEVLRFQVSYPSSTYSNIAIAMLVLTAISKISIAYLKDLISHCMLADKKLCKNDGKMRCIHQELLPFKLASKEGKAFHVFAHFLQVSSARTLDRWFFYDFW